ncbi:MAG: class I SAM-dependent methyltransferase [Anaerolineae bacterium]|nr:class I SAM-dependent methyltransferase [Anaerolineae bacterium]
METNRRFQGTLLHIASRWPTYLFGYGGGAVVALLLIVAGAVRRDWGLIPFGAILLLVVAYFFGANVWAAYRRYDVRGQRPADLFYHLGHMTPTTTFVHVSMGVRRLPQQLNRRLTSGRVLALDLYNPQQAPGAALARARQATAPAQPDPRLRWMEGSIQLLPLPDRSTSLVTADGALGALWQHGDRLILMREIYRILRPEGWAILAEPVRTQTNWLVRGSGALRLEPVTYWRHLFDLCGFNVVREQDVDGLVHYFVVERPAVGEMQQLTLDLGV